MAEHYDTIIVGAGQAGLAMSHHLQLRGLEHVLLERARIAERWRSERWDSLAFQMPNSTLSLPGMDYAGDDPDGFALYGEILRFIEDYAARFAAPVREGVNVTEIRPEGGTGRYCLETSIGPMTARNVVIATGPFHRPKVPEIAASVPKSIYQTDATHYKSPKTLPDGAVLVVGSGSSGSQIAHELLRSGRTVYLSLGRHRYTPRRYRGKDVIWWFSVLGRFDVPVDTFPNRKYPPPTVMTGVAGGYDLYPARMGAEGESWSVGWSALRMVAFFWPTMPTCCSIRPTKAAQISSRRQMTLPNVWSFPRPIAWRHRRTCQCGQSFRLT